MKAVVLGSFSYSDSVILQHLVYNSIMAVSITGFPFLNCEFLKASTTIQFYISVEAGRKNRTVLANCYTAQLQNCGASYGDLLGLIGEVSFLLCFLVVK